MPFLPFLLIVAIYFAAVTALMGAAVRLSTAICRIRQVGWRRSLAIGAALLSLSLVSLWIESAAPEHDLAVSLVMLAITLAGLALVIRAAGSVGWLRAALCSVLAIVFATALTLGAGVTVRTAGLMDFYHIPSDPMAPAVIAGDRIVVDGVSRVRRWDVVAYRMPASGEIYLHRIAGLPGETIEIVGGRITIDGAPAPAPGRLEAIRWDSTAHPRGIRNARAGQPMTLGDDEYFVVGDNVELSYDSRLWEAPGAGSASRGAVPGRNIVGIARLRYGPFERIGAVR